MKEELSGFNKNKIPIRPFLYIMELLAIRVVKKSYADY